MLKPVFTFSLQPALDVALERRKQWERAVQQTRAQILRELAVLDELRHAEQLSNQIATQLLRQISSMLHDGPLPNDLASIQQHLQLTTERQAELRQLIEAQRQAIDELRTKLAAQIVELNAAVAKQNQFQRLRDKQHAEHRQILQRAEDHAIEQTVVERFGHDQRGAR
jgi:phosphoenolpyruvate synthase/pyruvate phosphate dikinase